MSGVVSYAGSSESALKRTISRLVPVSDYHQDLAFHGPGFGAGQISTNGGIQAQLVLALTPIGDHDLKLHLAASVDESTLPSWPRTLFRLNPFLSLHDFLSRAITTAGADDTEGDYRIWRHKRSLKDPKLLPGEADIVRIREWMSQYYLKDFEQPPQPVKANEHKRWILLGRGGKLEADCLSCPFHHFFFNAEGEFVGSKPEGKPKPHMKLRQVEHRLSDDRVEVFV